MGVQNRKSRIAWKLRFETWSTWSEEILNSGQFCWSEFLLLNHSSTSGCLNGIVGLSWDRVARVLVAWARARVYTRAWQLSSPAGRRRGWEVGGLGRYGTNMARDCATDTIADTAFAFWHENMGENMKDWTKYWQTHHLKWIKHRGNANCNEISHGVIHFQSPVFPSIFLKPNLQEPFSGDDPF